MANLQFDPNVIVTALKTSMPDVVNAAIERVVTACGGVGGERIFSQVHGGLLDAAVRAALSENSSFLINDRAIIELFNRFASVGVPTAIAWTRANETDKAFGALLVLTGIYRSRETIGPLPDTVEEDIRAAANALSSSEDLIIATSAAILLDELESRGH